MVAIPGDGIGPEVIAAGRRVLDAVGAAMGFAFEWRELVVGGRAIDDYGVSIRDEDLAVCAAADAVYLGAIGGPKWDDPDGRGPSRSRRSSPFGAASACTPTCGR